MSCVFDALFRGFEQLEGDTGIRLEIRLVLDALHESSHSHEDWLNRDRGLRIAANRLEQAIKRARRAGSEE